MIETHVRVLMQKTYHVQHCTCKHPYEMQSTGSTLCECLLHGDCHKVEALHAEMYSFHAAYNASQGSGHMLCHFRPTATWRAGLMLRTCPRSVFCLCLIMVHVFK